MSTLTYTPLTSNPLQQTTSSSGPLVTTSQNSQPSTTSSQSQAAVHSYQRSITQSKGDYAGSQLSKANHAPSPSSSQSASRISSQLATPNKTLPIKRDSPGAWKHPRAEEIARRQRAGTFGADNVSLILKSIAALVAFEVVWRNLPNFAWKLLSPVSQLTGDAPWYVMWISTILTIFFAFRPFVLGPDQLLDIDLNATQRSLLGLDPNATPPTTPATKYVTPPKYSRSATPRTGTPGSRGSSPADSPLAYKDNSGYRRSSDSLSLSRRASFSSDSRKQSFGLSASVFGTPSKDGSVFAPQTPSPIGRGSGIPFSNKWLYHKATTGAMSRDSF